MADSHVGVIKDALLGDIKTVLGCDTESVVFGAPLREIPTPGACVRWSIDRPRDGARAIREEHEITIDLHLDPEHSEIALLGIAYDLVQLVSPYSLTTVLATAVPPYAGALYAPKVSRIFTTPTDEAQAHRAVRLMLQGYATMYQ